MRIKDMISFLKESNEFIEWKKKNKDSYLSHVFFMKEGDFINEYDFGFFDTKKKAMSSFIINTASQSIEIKENVEVFKREEDKIEPLDIDSVSIDVGDALDGAINLQKDKYASHAPLKVVVILQKLSIGQVYNITFITKQFSTLNIKIDSKTGDIIEDKIHQIFSM